MRQKSLIYGHLRPARIQVRPHFTGREQRWRQRLDRHAAQQQARQARRAARVHERAERRATPPAAAAPVAARLGQVKGGGRP